MTGLDVALACSQRGWRVFPVSIVYRSGGHTEKRPLVRWTEEATTDESAVRDFWAAHPAARCGVVTGASSGLYVVDVDRPSTPDDLSLDVSGGLQVATSRPGGFHLYYSAPTDGGEVRNSQDGGLDVRGDGGMVVCWNGPPDGDPPPLPADLAAWARERSSTTVSHADVTSLDVIHWPGGGSDAWVVSMAGTMCRRGLQEAAALAALLAENDNGRFSPQCNPEWLAEKVRGVYERYWTGLSVSPALLHALDKIRERG